MREKIINFLKQHPQILDFFWTLARRFLQFFGVFTRPQKKIVFASFGGRKYDDSPRAIYEEICKNGIFTGWDLVWAFVYPGEYQIPRGRKVKIDTLQFFHELLTAKVWVSNSGMDRGIELQKKGIVKVETWHGAPLKKIGGDENQTSMMVKKDLSRIPLDCTTIRCAQSEYDLEIFMRIFHATKDSFLLSDLPRNDELLRYSSQRLREIKKTLGVPENRSIILYAPTYREYLIDANNENYLAPPIDLNKWEKQLGDDYVILFRAHYAVGKALGIKDSPFLKDVSNYPHLNDLYAVADVLISDYSSCFIDYSILNRPMFCFAYDLDEYREKRGLYLDLETCLPCTVDKSEDVLLGHIKSFNYEAAAERTKKFHMQYAPYAGHASQAVVEAITKRLEEA